MTLKACQTLNPLTLMPIGPCANLTHFCVETTEQVYPRRPDLRDTLLDNPDEKWYSDGSSYIHRARYAVVSLNFTVESGPLPPNTSAQKSKLNALTRALRLGEGKKVKFTLN